MPYHPESPRFVPVATLFAVKKASQKRSNRRPNLVASLSGDVGSLVHVLGQVDCPRKRSHATVRKLQFATRCILQQSPSARPDGATTSTHPRMLHAIRGETSMKGISKSFRDAKGSLDFGPIEKTGSPPRDIRNSCPSSALLNRRPRRSVMKSSCKQTEEPSRCAHDAGSARSSLPR